MQNRLYAFALIILMGISSGAMADPATLLNVSYDPTREFYNAYNPLFTRWWKEKTGEDIEVRQSHGGSGTQARAVNEGLHADVVTLALGYDIDKIVEHGLLRKDWQSVFPNNSCPYNSIVVFLVRKGNPKHIKDWDDLIRNDVQVVTPNPKTSGGARWNYLAAWGYAYKKNHDSEDAARAYVSQLYKHVPILDAGARGATTNFTMRGIGDVLITWEDEALLVTHNPGGDQFEVVTPSTSILAEPAVAVVDKNARDDGLEKAAHDYLDHLYSKEAQELIAKYYYRPENKDVAKEYSSLFPTIPLFKVSDFGGWEKVTEKHFSDGGIFDQVYMK